MVTVTDIKDGISIIATLAGLYIAFAGLKTWKRALKGSVEYELTRRLMKSTYKLREAIGFVRNPVMWSHEMPEPDGEKANEMSYEEKRFHGLENGYQKRWEKIIEARDDLRPDLLEAETIWNKEIHKIFKKMFYLQTELYINIRNYLQICNPKTPPPSKEAIEKLMRAKRDVLYDLHSSDMPDPYFEDLQKAIEEIEGYLKPYLKK